MFFIKKNQFKSHFSHHKPIKKIPTVKFDLLGESDLKNLKFIFILDPRFCVEEVLYKTRNLILANFQTKQIPVCIFSLRILLLSRDLNYNYPGIFTPTMESLLPPCDLYSNSGIFTPTLGSLLRPWDITPNPGILLQPWYFTLTLGVDPALGIY